MNYIKELVYPAEWVERRKPILMPDEHEHLFSSELKRGLPSVKPLELSGAYLTPNGILFDRWKINDNQFGIRLGLKSIIKLYLKAFESLFRIRRIVKLKKVIYLTNLDSGGFFHWFLDVLQKMEYFDAKLPLEIRQNYIVVMPPSHQGSYFQKSLEAYNFNVFYQQEDELLFFENAILVPDLAPTGNYRKEIIQKITERFKSRWSSMFGGECCKKIYITRKNAKKRKIINEDKLCPILEEHGFLILDFDVINFDEQVRHIMECDFLVSLHGAGLTHMLWMRGQSKILEIRAKGDSHNNCYFTLASDLNHKYFYAFAEKDDLNMSTQTANFIVEIDDFKIALEKLLDS